MKNQHTISDVSQRSGIPRDLLRQWERRYGYPDPERDENGDRIYTNQQLDKLVLIRQLLAQGKRPGKLVKLSADELRAMLVEPAAAFDTEELLELLKGGDARKLTDWLESLITKYGLRQFVHNVMTPATTDVGNAWSQGELAIYEEHLYTEVMKRIVRKQLAEIPTHGNEPRVMLTTVPGEKHSLGLLMVEILLRLGGAEVVAFGTEMPFKEIREAAENHNVQVIGLSFSASFKTEDALVMLRGLRQVVSPDISIWAGGGAFKNNTDIPDGVDLLDTLQSVENKLTSWENK